MSQQMRNKLTGLLPADQQPTAQEQLAKLQTLETHILIPLLQNILGGVAVTGAISVAWLMLARALDVGADPADYLFWGGCVGGLVTFMATTIRYFSDDLGIVQAAINKGRADADAQINGLVAENQQLRATVRELRGESPSHKATEMVERIQRAQDDAENLLSLAHAGQSIAREKVAPVMPQRSWEKAIQLMKAAGTLDANGTLTERNLGLSLKRLRAYADQDLQRAQSGSWRPKWYVEAKR